MSSEPAGGSTQQNQMREPASEVRHAVYTGTTGTCKACPSFRRSRCPSPVTSDLQFLILIALNTEVSWVNSAPPFGGGTSPEFVYSFLPFKARAHISDFRTLMCYLDERTPLQIPLKVLPIFSCLRGTLPFPVRRTSNREFWESGVKCVWTADPVLSDFLILGRESRGPDFQGKCLSFCMSVMGSTFTFKLLRTEKVHQGNANCSLCNEASAPPAGWLEQRP